MVWSYSPYCILSGDEGGLYILQPGYYLPRCLLEGEVGADRCLHMYCIMYIEYKSVKLTYYSIVVKLTNVRNNKFSGHQAEGGRHAKVIKKIIYYFSKREHHNINEE
jgi:hypothetical protein